jgi:hypothetical protein
MVITNICGGLGNQMFQYAIGRATALRLNMPLKVDVSSFSIRKIHQGFELTRVFSCAPEVVGVEDMRAVLGWQTSLVVRRLVLRRQMATFRRKEFVVEPYFHFWKEILNVSGNCYLQGYWQSEKYFSEAATKIRKDFVFCKPLENQSLNLARQISKVNSVSLHVRRGDYANNPLTTSVHGLCSLDYYMAAIKYITERVQEPRFFIFSDDIEWVKNNLKLSWPCEYVDCNRKDQSYNDMRLMSMCKHNIIANSSFSWWGAWLNPNLYKIVIAPNKWFANEINTQDLIPLNWVRL